MNISAPVVAAVIVSITTFLTVMINVWSARIARSEDRREKNEEWLREKQIRDIEVIIPTLSIFLNKLSKCVNKVYANQVVEVDSLSFELQTRKADEITGFAESIIYSKERTQASLKERLKTFDEVSSTLWKDASERGDWFAFDSKRLCIWLDDSDAVVEELQTIARLCRDYQHSVYHATAKVNTHFRILSGRRGDLTDEDVLKAKELQEASEIAREDWASLNSTILQFQKKLADKYKYGSTVKPASVNDNGLLVQIALQIERVVRNIFSLI